MLYWRESQFGLLWITSKHFWEMELLYCLIFFHNEGGGRRNISKTVNRDKGEKCERTGRRYAQARKLCHVEKCRKRYGNIKVSIMTRKLQFSIHLLIPSLQEMHINYSIKSRFSRFKYEILAWHFLQGWWDVSLVHIWGAGWGVLFQNALMDMRQIMSARSSPTGVFDAHLTMEHLREQSSWMQRRSWRGGGVGWGIIIYCWDLPQRKQVSSVGHLRDPQQKLRSHCAAWMENICQPPQQLRNRLCAFLC